MFIAVLLIATMGAVVSTAGPAAADSTLCNSFSSCTSAGYSTHGWQNSLNNSYWRAYPGHNCTNYVGYRLTQNGDPGHNALMGDAGSWDNTIRANSSWGYAINSTPAVGSIAQWEPNSAPYIGGSGHVAYVEQVTATSITISEDNYPSGPFRWRTISVGSSAWPSQFLHIKDVGNQPVVNAPIQWHLRNENTDGGASVAFSYGTTATDHPIVGDWDGNGTFTPGIVRNVNGEWQWHLRNDNSDGGAFVAFNYGSAISDHPIVGDWDGNGTFTPGIVRNSGGVLQWHFRNQNSAGGASVSFSYGSANSDTPVVGDWDGNGTFTPGIVRNVGGEWQWHLRNDNSDGGANTAFNYGSVATDYPRVGDWDGNGTFTPGIVRSSGGVWQWHLRDSNTPGSATISFSYGAVATDMPITGDWNGDGTYTPGITRAG